VTVFSNDPVNPKFMLTVNGMIEVIAGLEPNRLDLKNVAKGAVITKTVKVVAKEPDKLKITEVTTGKPEQLKAELIQEGGLPAIKVTFTAPDKPGRFSDRVVAKTNLKSPKELQLYVFGQVSADLVVDRSYVYFPALKVRKDAGMLANSVYGFLNVFDNRRGLMKVKVTSLDGKPFKITGIEDPGGSVLGKAVKKDDAWLVHLMLGNKPSAPRGTIKIKTDRKDQPAIDVRYGTATTARPGGARVTPGMRPGQNMPIRRLDPGGRPRPSGKSVAPNKFKIAPKLRRVPDELRKKSVPIKKNELSPKK
jgi:hypothetical protein